MKGKKKKKWQLIGGIIAAVLVAGAVIIFVTQRNSKITSFDGVVEIKDSIALKQQKTTNPELKMSILTASTSSTGTAEDLDSFEKGKKNGIDSAALTINIPSIGALFALSSAQLSDAGNALVSAFANYYLQTDQSAVILVEGYTCNLGKDSYNYVLSKNRAEAVKNVLLQQGVNPDKLEVQWFGKRRFIDFKFSSLEKYRRVNVSIK